MCPSRFTSTDSRTGVLVVCSRCYGICEMKH
jgi:hypothetical protein